MPATRPSLHAVPPKIPRGRLSAPPGPVSDKNSTSFRRRCARSVLQNNVQGRVIGGLLALALIPVDRHVDTTA